MWGDCDGVPSGVKYLRLFAVPAQSYHSTFFLLFGSYPRFVGSYQFHRSGRSSQPIWSSTRKWAATFVRSAVSKARLIASPMLASLLTQNGIPGPKPSCLVLPSPVVPSFVASRPILSKGSGASPAYGPQKIRYFISLALLILHAVPAIQTFDQPKSPTRRNTRNFLICHNSPWTGLRSSILNNHAQSPIRLVYTHMEILFRRRF